MVVKVGLYTTSVGWYRLNKAHYESVSSFTVTVELFSVFPSGYKPKGLGDSFSEFLSVPMAIAWVHNLKLMSASSHARDSHPVKTDPVRTSQMVKTWSFV